MKVTSQEVKTIYSIEIELTDFIKIYLAAKDDVTRFDAFEQFDLENDDMEYIRNCFNRLDNFNNAKDMKYIVSKLGFDGIVNYGFMKTLMNNKKVYRLTVYNYGEVFL